MLFEKEKFFWDEENGVSSGADVQLITDIMKNYKQHKNVIK